MSTTRRANEATVTSIIQPSAAVAAADPLSPVTTTLTLPASSGTAAAAAASATSKVLPRKTIIAIAAGAGIAVLLIIIATAIFCIRRKRQRSRDSFRMRTNNLRTSIIGMPQPQSNPYEEKNFEYKADYRVEPSAYQSDYNATDVYRGAQVDQHGRNEGVYRAW